MSLTSSPYSFYTYNVVDGAITTSKLANDAVTLDKIQPNIISSVDGVINDGGNVDLIMQNAITIAADDSANTITIGENHSARTDNPHSTTAAQTGALMSVDGVSNPGGNVDLIPGSNVTINPSDDANTIIISSASFSDVWKLTGNAGTNPTTNFLGTTDNIPLELKVNSTRAMKFVPNDTSPNP